MRTLKPTKDSANWIYQGSAEIYLTRKKKPFVFIVINERKKKKFYLAFLITSLFPFFSLSLMGEWLRDFVNKRQIYVVFYLRKNKGWYMILKILCKFTSIILHI